MEAIKIVEEKCVGCNNCIRVCPTTEANNAIINQDQKLVIHVDTVNCIKCGACMTACDHKARYFMDDTERFFHDLKKGEKISLIIAPSIKERN